MGREKACGYTIECGRAHTQEEGSRSGFSKGELGFRSRVNLNDQLTCVSLSSQNSYPKLNVKS
jgi:hypothetical protein